MCAGNQRSILPYFAARMPASNDLLTAGLVGGLTRNPRAHANQVLAARYVQRPQVITTESTIGDRVDRRLLEGQ